MNKMTAAYKIELTLSALLRGLTLRRKCVDFVHTDRRSISTLVHPKISKTNAVQSSIQDSNFKKHVSSSASCDLSTPRVICFGVCVQHCRSYGRMPPRPKKIVSFDYSGDLMTQPALDLEQTHVDFSKVLPKDESNELVRKLCSLDFASGTEKKIHRKEEMRERILHLFGNDADREMQVAMLTVDIRNLIPHVLTIKKDKWSKSLLVEKIQKRKKFLKILRRTDYERFMWLLKELQIRYVLPKENHGRVPRKEKIKQEVWEKANNVRLKKIADLKAQLEAEREDFFKYKEETLRKIREDAEHYGLDLAAYEKSLKRERIGKTYPKILTWEEREQLKKEESMQ